MAALPFPTPALPTLRRSSIHSTRPPIARAFLNRATTNANVLVLRPNALQWEHGNARLEEELFEFMEASDTPNHFPTKDDLLSAGRADLVHGIITHGGWLAAGWDPHPLHVHADEADNSDSDVDFDDDVDDDNGLTEIEKQQPPAHHAIDVKAEDVSEEESGVAAMINRLERERALSYSEAASGKNKNGLHRLNGSVESWKTVRGMEGVSYS